MANEARDALLAVLIDADNTSAQIADGLFAEIATLGEASVRRIYGDFSSSRSRGWADVLVKHAINPHQQFAYTTGKNASDIALVIDAMDLLHSGRVSGFCLVSSDSDFTRLASRIREEGMEVFGFGEKKTPESLRLACKRFIFTENLLPGAGTADARTDVEPVSGAAGYIGKVLDELAGEGGWVGLGQLGAQVAKIAPDFDSRTYGYRKLSDLVRSVGQFELDGEGAQLRVRRKPASAKTPKKR